MSPPTSSDTIDLDGFNLVASKLQALVDSNPAKAVEEARALPSNKPVGGIYFASLKAGVLVDAGSHAKDKRAIEEGVGLFRKLLAKSPKEAGYHYNLGNGLMALADLDSFAGHAWYLNTAEIRREARSHFQKAISSDRSAAFLSTAFTNLGNALLRSHRWIEAYDAYTDALKHDSSNAVASTGAAKILLRCMARSIGDKRVLQSVAAQHLKSAKLHQQRLAELAGLRANDQLASLLEIRLRSWKPPNLRDASDYEKFVARHRLALSPTIEGLDYSLKRWDSLRLHSITEPVAIGSGVPPLFAMLNVMKSDFLAARYLAFHALTSQFPESGLYADTLDYALYGMVPSLLSLAQRACIDMLDKIAVAATEYFGIPGDAKVVYFWSRWFENPQKGQPLAWHPSLLPQIEKGNAAIIALAEMAFDLADEGFLYRKKAFRHSSTHRFTVLHDIGCSPSRDCVHIEHANITEFKDHLIESLQLARAAIVYFVEMVSITESLRAAGPDKQVAISIPNHHEIRGHNNIKNLKVGEARRAKTDHP